MASAVHHNARSADKQPLRGNPSEVDATVTLSRGQGRILELIKRCDFTGEGCWPTQDELAFLSGYKRPYVNACVKSLERAGHIRIEKRRSPGCKWSHNVYFVRDWSPNVRRGICNLRAAFKDSRARRPSCSQASSDTERTARPSRAQTPPVNPFLTAAVENQRCGREARNPNLTCETCGRTIRPQGRCRMADPLRLPVDCDECARKDRIIRQYAENHSKLVEEVSSAHEVARAAGKEVTKLKGQITRRANEDAEADDIRFLLEDWKRDHPKAQIPEGGRRWDVAKKALRLMKDDPAGAKGACSEALEGLRLAPYQRYDKRYALPDPEDPKRVLRNDIEHALGDERRIEACRRIARAVKASPAEKLWWMYEQTAPVSEAYFRLAVDELERPAAGSFGANPAMHQARGALAGFSVDAGKAEER